MLHYIFMTYDYGGISCVCDGTGGMTGNGDSTGVHRSRNGKPHVKRCLLSHETRELVEQRYNHVIILHVEVVGR